MEFPRQACLEAVAEVSSPPCFPAAGRLKSVFERRLYSPSPIDAGTSCCESPVAGTKDCPTIAAVSASTCTASASRAAVTAALLELAWSSKAVLALVPLRGSAQHGRGCPDEYSGDERRKRAMAGDTDARYLRHRFLATRPYWYAMSMISRFLFGRGSSFKSCKQSARGSGSVGDE